MTAPVYAPKPILLVEDDAATEQPVTSLAALYDIAASPDVSYSSLLWRVDAAGGMLEDLTPYVVKDSQPATVSRSCTDELAGKLNITLSRALTWGKDRVMPVLLARPSVSTLLADPGDWYAFRLGIFTVTSPGNGNMDAVGKYAVTGYDPVYLLQSDAATSFAFGAGTTYLAAVTAVFQAAGLLGTSDPLSSVCDYPGAWAAKTLPAADTFPLSDANSHVQIVNKMLAESGCRSLYAHPHTGRYAIETIPKPATQPLRWQWAGGPTIYAAAAGYPDRKIVLYGQQAYAGDVYNATNRWVFVQSGLTFTPTHSDGTDGRYVVDNLTGQPAGQNIVGRIVAKTETLEASGTADLIAQGDALVAAEKAQQETVQMSTAPWPAACHFDVFRYSHPALPGDPVRRLQAQSWSLPLDGSPMTWQCNVVGAS